MSAPLRVLAVEDSADDAELVALALRRGGFEVEYERVDAPEAMRAALARGRWDVIVSDYVMPGFSGLAALQLVREMGLDLPFILVSGAIADETAIAAMKAGSHDYVSKQNLARLVPAVRRELDEAQVRRERRQAQEALGFLAEASVLFASSLDYQSTVEHAARLAVPRLGEGCVIDVIEGGDVRRVANAHEDPEKLALMQELARRYPPVLSSPQPPAVVIRTGRPLLVAELGPGHFDDFSIDSGHSELIRAIGLRTLISVPLFTRGEVVGAMTLIASTPGRRFGAADLRLAEEFAHRSALAIDNARLYRDAQAAARRASFLAEAGRILGESLDDVAALERIARLLVPELADTCSIVLMDEGRPMHVAIAHVDPLVEARLRALYSTRTVDLESPEGVAKVLRTGAPELISEVPPGLSEGTSTRRLLTRAAAVAGPAAPDRLGSLDAMRSYMAVPLVMRGRTIGALAFAIVRPSRRFGPDDLALAEELARRTSAALQNAALYRAAQEGLRVREEFLSIASHELRTPLTVLKLQVQMLLRPEVTLAELAPARLAQTLDVMRRQVDRLALLVDNLLDVSRLTTEKLQLTLEEVDLAAIVKRVVARFGPELARSGCVVELRADEPAVGRWDRSRLDQVLVSLLSNAIKFGAGAPIAITIERIGDFVRLTVRDHGIGIAPQDVARIFGRFERAVSAEHYGGLGLGLHITRQIVEAHGGTIHVESRPDEGSTFIVELPAVRSAESRRTPIAAGEDAPPSSLRRVMGFRGK